MKLRISENIKDRLFAHAEKDAPIEACGYLTGNVIDPSARPPASLGMTGEEPPASLGITEISEVCPMTNTDKSEEHFSFDPKEQFEVVKAARAKGREVVAVYHSHPASPARPSDEDIKLAFDPKIVYLIVSLVDNTKTIKAFSIVSGKVSEVELEVEKCSLPEAAPAVDSGNIRVDESDPAALKQIGIIQQKQKGLYAMRLHVVGGDLNAAQLKKIAEVSDKYADGEVHLSTRQGVEIHNVKGGDLVQARADLKSADIEMGACGPRIRIVVACPGDTTCRWGIINTKKLAARLDDEYFRKDTPHKFKFSVTGCPHNCAKATENDIGVMGGILPKWEKEECINCDLCVNVCPTGAIYKENDEYKLNVDKCIFCSICTSTCPTDTWVVDKKGYSLFVGGTMGKKPRLATKLKVLIADEKELMVLIDRTVELYRKHGRKKERFGHCIDRVGEEKVKKEILDGV